MNNRTQTVPGALVFGDTDTTSSQPLVPSTPQAQVITPKSVSTQLVVITEDDILRLGESTADTTAAVSERLLTAQRNGDTGEMGELLNDLILKAKDLSPDQLAKKGLLGKLVGVFGRTKESFMGKYDNTQNRIKEIVAQLDAQANLQKKRIVDLEDLRDQNYQFYLNLQEDIKRGQEMLIHIQGMIDQAEINAQTDAFAANKVTEYKGLYHMVEKRIDDFTRVALVSQQTEPQLQQMKANSRDLVQTFATIKNTTIPLWRNIFSQYLISIDQKRGAALAKNVNDATNEAIRKSADLLGQNTVDIANAREQSVVSIETLEYNQNKLIEALDQVAAIEKKGREDRIAAAPKLQALEKALVERFANGPKR